ncbi:MAG: hypothetical protein HQ546_09330 [Planctomycetes bacterium]|nr:hypothetical protein [Planctomycetota bacterium]
MPPVQPEKNPDEIDRFVASLSPEERMLVVLKRELYEGSWEQMLSDLQSRLEGRPYVFKLANRIADDITRIGTLREFETAYGLDLADYVNLDSSMLP